MWTDERLDDRFDRIDQRFDAVEQRLDRIETEMRDGFRELRGEIAALRRDMHHAAIALAVGYLGLIAALLARGL